MALQSHALRVLDPAGNEKWERLLSPTTFPELVQADVPPGTTGLSYRNLGHLVVLPLGHRVFGVDPIHRTLLWEKDLCPDGAARGLGTAPPRLIQVTVDPREPELLATYPDGWVQRPGSGAVLETGVLCLQMRDGLVGVNPLTGRTLWTRADVNPNSRIFGHDQVLFVVEMKENRAITTRALRIQDGVAIKLPDFSTLYPKRVGRAGRTLVLREPGPGDTMTLRLHDLVRGQDTWKRSFPRGSILLKPVDAGLAGVIEPDGKVHVIDVGKNREVLTGQVDPRQFAWASQIWLLADAQDFFLASNQPRDPLASELGEIPSNLLAGAGLHNIPVNGEICCLNAANGKLRWRRPVTNQMLVLEHFHELPFVLLTARSSADANRFDRGMARVRSVRSIQKSDGEITYDNDKLPNGTYFHTLNVNPRPARWSLSAVS